MTSGGIYTIELTVTDDDEIKSNPFQQEININERPKAFFEMLLEAGQPVASEFPAVYRLDARKASDDGQIQEYHWSISEGELFRTKEDAINTEMISSLGTSAFLPEDSVFWRVMTSGVYTIELTVTDDTGVSSELVKQEKKLNEVKSVIETTIVLRFGHFFLKI